MYRHSKRLAGGLLWRCGPTLLTAGALILIACCRVEGDRSIHVYGEPGNDPPVVVGSETEVHFHTSAWIPGALGGPAKLSPTVLWAGTAPQGVFATRFDENSVWLEALRPGKATVTVWGRAAGLASKVAFPAKAVAPAAYGYRLYAGGSPGIKTCVPGQKSRWRAGFATTYCRRCMAQTTAAPMTSPSPSRVASSRATQADPRSIVATGCHREHLKQQISLRWGCPVLSRRRSSSPP